jgi:hypothetical protein
MDDTEFADLLRELQDVNAPRTVIADLEAVLASVLAHFASGEVKRRAKLLVV